MKKVRLKRVANLLLSLPAAPASIQVEVCSDPAFASWTLIRAPRNTLGLTRIRVPSGYRTPVYAVRLYLQRPPESATMGLQQIMLVGSSSTALALDAANGGERQARVLVQWLTIFNKLSLVDPSVWNYAPRLPEALTQLALSRALPAETYALLHQVRCWGFPFIGIPTLKQDRLVQKKERL